MQGIRRPASVGKVCHGRIGAHAHPRAAPLLDAGTGPGNPGRHGRHARRPALAVRAAAVAGHSSPTVTLNTFQVLALDTLGDISEVP